jgi:hypothetical protein
MARPTAVGVLVAVVVAVSGSASARPPLVDRTDACDCNPVLVDWGHTRRGQEWIQRFSVKGDVSGVRMDFPRAPGINDRWTYSGQNRQVLKKPPYLMILADELASGETVVAGATPERVHSLRMVLVGRPPLVIHPRKVSRALRRRFPVLQHRRFYARQIEGQVTLKNITAQDGAGRSLGRQTYSPGGSVS